MVEERINPKITVLLPVFNGGEFIAESVQSILDQSYSNFELLVINDGSTDETASKLRSFKDHRLRLLENDRNLGLIATLNRGLSVARGEYIARMDADDISLPNRLAVQNEYLDGHPEVVVVGAAFVVFGTESVAGYPTTDSEIKIGLLDNCRFAHPTVMYRSDPIRRVGYKEGYLHAEDYRLWIDLARTSKMANLPEVLLEYRTHENQITSKNSHAMNATRRRIVGDYLGMILGRSVSPTEMGTHMAFLGDEPRASCAELDSWIANLRVMGRENIGWEAADFERFVAERYLRLLDRTLEYRIPRRLAEMFGK